jgi:hypothetical protein
METPKHFFESNISLDVKIQVLNKLNFKTVEFLCTINNKVRQICNTQKFWRYRIYHFLHKSFPDVKQPILTWFEFYKKNALCYCNNEICFVFHPNLGISNSYCPEHLWNNLTKIYEFFCPQKLTRGRNKGVTCGTPLSNDYIVPYCERHTKKCTCGNPVFVKNKLNYCERCLKKYVFQIPI